jgi:hypothetical protein
VVVGQQGFEKNVSAVVGRSEIDYRTLHNEKHDLCNVLNTFKFIKNKQAEMARECGTYGGKKECVQNFDGETLRKDSI